MIKKISSTILLKIWISSSYIKNFNSLDRIIITIFLLLNIFFNYRENAKAFRKIEIESYK